jgi:hypothetical protein
MGMFGMFVAMFFMIVMMMLMTFVIVMVSMFFVVMVVIMFMLFVIMMVSVIFVVTVVVIMVLFMFFMVVMMFMTFVVVMIVKGNIHAFLFDAFDFYVDMGTADSAFDRSNRSDFDIWDAEMVETMDEILGIGVEFQQGRHQHIAGGTHVALEIERLHFFTSIWLIMLAR